MRHLATTTRFKRDVERMQKRGKNRAQLAVAVEMLRTDGTVPPSYRPHKLSGKWHNVSECHIEPDWLLLYTVSDRVVTLYRTGSHNDLFQ